MVSHCPLEEKVFSIREQPIDFACWLGSLAQSGQPNPAQPRASAYKAESRGFESRRSPLFLPLSFHHSDYTAVSFSPSYTNQAGLGLVAPDFINHFVD